MAKGKATKATKAPKTARGKASKADKSSKARKPAAATKSSKSSKAAKPARASKPTKPTKSAKSKKPEVKAKAKAAKPAPAAPAPTAAPVLPTAVPKKRNVKRGAPPMLPRRMARRPEPGAAPQGPPPPPRLATPPGSLHAPARAPDGAEDLKHRLSAVMTLLAQLRGLRRTLQRHFFEAGLVLQRLAEPNLFSAKGYGSFDKFVEREIERELSIGRSVAHDLVLIVQTFQREAAEEIGLERLRAGLRAIWPEAVAGSGAHAAVSASDVPKPIEPAAAEATENLRPVRANLLGDDDEEEDDDEDGDVADDEDSTPDPESDESSSDSDE